MVNISIIVPVYNVEKYLKKSIESLLNQTLKEIEILLINDGSTDSSLDICKEYASNDCRVRIINKSNEGVSISRNVGIENASGDYIMFVDSDDWIEPNMCKIIYDTIISEKADIVFVNHIMEYKNQSKKILFNSLNESIFNDNIKNQIIIPLIEENKNNLIHQRASFRSPWGKLFKKSIIDYNNIRFNKELTIGEDFIFNLEYLKFCQKAVMKSDCLYHYRINEGSVLNRYKEDSWNIYKNLLIKLEAYLKENFDEKEYFNRLNKLKIKYFMMCIQNEMNPLNNKSVLKKREYIKNICNDEIMKISLKKYSKGVNGNKNRLKLFLLRNKIYLPFAII